MTPGERRPERRRRFDITTRPLIYGGNRLRLLQNGEEYFPLLLAAINSAEQSVRLETYIFANDNIGTRVSDALAAAADRGVRVRLVVDGFGTGAFAAELKSRLASVGAEVFVYRPARWWRPDRRLLRRLHRKLALIDDRLAFVGGINIIDDHDYPDPQPAPLGPRFDFAVMCEGPVVAAIDLTMQRLWRSIELRQLRRRLGVPAPPPPQLPPPYPDGMRAVLLLRDNLRHRHTIERAYLDAFSAARVDVLIAIAYFLPGRVFRKALVTCAKRGVRVRLLVQGRIEYPIQHYAQEALYAQLLEAGIEIHEYTASYLHAKAAVVDETWATVGSSNIDPYSLLLAREANLGVYDARFARLLRSALERAIVSESRRVDPASYAGRGLVRRAANWIAYAIVRFGAVVFAGGRDY